MVAGAWRTLPLLAGTAVETDVDAVYSLHDRDVCLGLDRNQ